jgi:hypothetical protein
MFPGLVVLAGCATAPANPCSMATDHLAACTDEAPAFRTGTCDERRADTLLALDCHDLQDLAQAGRADGWWDPFLCELEFADHCGPGDAGPDHHTVVGTVRHLDDTPAVAVYVRLIEDGQVVRGSWTFAGGLFAFPELDQTTYRLEVALTPTSATLFAQTLGGEGFVELRAPLPL